MYKHKKGPVSVQLDLGVGEQPGSARRGATFQAAPLSLGSGNADVFAAVADYAFSKRTSAFLEADATVARGGAVGRETEYWGGTPVTDVGKSTRIGVMLGLRHQF